jgi:hypothetical protein
MNSKLVVSAPVENSSARNNKQFGLLYPLQLRGLAWFLRLLAQNHQKLQATLTKAALPFFNALTSRIGGSPKNVLYSRLNWLTLS